MHVVSVHCSEGSGGSEDSVVAYYMSEFDMPIRLESTVDEAIGSMDPMVGHQGRMGSRSSTPLHINNVMSGGTV